MGRPPTSRSRSTLMAAAAWEGTWKVQCPIPLECPSLAMQRFGEKYGGWPCFWNIRPGKHCHSLRHRTWWTWPLLIYPWIACWFSIVMLVYQRVIGYEWDIIVGIWISSGKQTKSYWTWPIWFVDLPMNSMLFFHSYMLVYCIHKLPPRIPPLKKKKWPEIFRFQISDLPGRQLSFCGEFVDGAASLLRQICLGKQKGKELHKNRLITRWWWYEWFEWDFLRLKPKCLQIDWRFRQFFLLNQFWEPGFLWQMLKNITEKSTTWKTRWGKTSFSANCICLQTGHKKKKTWPGAIPVHQVRHPFQ